jgi:hypothetical protein
VFATHTNGQPITGPTNPTNQTSASFSYSASDPDDTGNTLSYACSLVQAGASSVIPLTTCGSTGASATGPLSDGSYTFTVSVTDPAGNRTSASYQWKIDTVAPTTSASTSPAPNAAGWNNSNTTVTLNATDNTGGSGVKQITYSLNGGQPTTVTGSTASVVVTANGTTTITYFATDNAGNVEAQKSTVVKLDTKAPTVTITSGTINTTGGFETGTATAGFSGVDHITVTFTPQAVVGSAQTQTRTVPTYSGSSCSPACGTPAGSSGSITVNWSVPLSGLAIGTYTVTITATSVAGVTGPSVQQNLQITA